MEIIDSPLWNDANEVMATGETTTNYSWAALVHYEGFDYKVLHRCFTDVFEQRLIRVFSICQRMTAAVQSTGEWTPFNALAAIVTLTNRHPRSIQ